MGDFVTGHRLLASARALSLQLPEDVRTAVNDLLSSAASGGGGEDAVVVDDYVGDFGYTARCIQVAVEAAVDQGKSGILFNQGTWNVDPDSIALGDFDDAVVDIPSNFRVIGRPRALIVQKGLGTTPYDGSPFYHLFRCPDGTQDVLFEGLNFAGEKPEGSYTYNHQSSAILVLIVNSKNITTQRCTFRDLWGFPVHDPGSNLRINAFENRVLRCANGININSDYSDICWNQTEDSEGLECGGAHQRISFNRFKNALGIGISAGGDLDTFRPGTQITHNIIDGVAEVDGQVGIGIIMATNFGRGRVAENYVRFTDSHGLVLGGDATTVEVQIHDNEFYSCGKAGGNCSALNLASSVGSWHSIRGNIAKDLGHPSYNQNYGLHLGQQNCRVEDNDLGGTVSDAVYLPAATGTLERNNRYFNGSQYVHPGATFADPDYSWRGA